MRLAQTTEWMLVAALIVYTVFLPGLPAVRRVVGSPLGTAGSVLGLYLLAKKVSVPLALVAFVALARSSSAVLREHMNTDCGCSDPTYTYDSGLKRCVRGVNEVTSPTCCGIGQVWDGLQSKCTSSLRTEGGAMSVPDTAPVDSKISSVNNGSSPQ